MDGTGPEHKGTKTGRQLGTCNSENSDMSLLGKGMAKRRKSGGGNGKGKRIKYDKNELKKYNESSNNSF